MADSSAPTKRVCAIVLLQDDGSAALQLRDNKPGLRRANNWCFPGGHCRPGEMPERAAHREMTEETGYRCRALHRLVTLFGRYDRGYPPFEITFFWEKYDSSQTLVCYEGQKIEFVTRQKAWNRRVPRYLFGIWDQALLEFSKAFKTPPLIAPRSLNVAQRA